MHPAGVLRDSAGQNITRQAYDSTFVGSTWSSVGSGNLYDINTFASAWDPRWIWNSLPVDPSGDQVDRCGDGCSILGKLLQPLCSRISAFELTLSAVPLDLWAGTPEGHSTNQLKDIRVWTCQHSLTSSFTFAPGMTTEQESGRRAAIAAVWGQQETPWTDYGRSGYTFAGDFPGSQFFEEAAVESYRNRVAAETWVAAALPKTTIAALVLLDSTTPSTARIKISDGARNIVLTLQVIWKRVWLITALLCGLQAFVILAGLTWCRGVMLRDDSFFSNAKLLELLVSEIDGGTTASGEELADTLLSEVRYGTVHDLRGEGELEARLWRIEKVTGVFHDGKVYC